MNKQIGNLIKEQRKLHNLTQIDLANAAGVGIRFVRELEAGKPTLRMDKVNAVLFLFGLTLGAVNAPKYEEL